jgi:hypothetical protein
MKLFPFTEFYLLSPLSETEIKLLLSPEQKKLGLWHFKRKNDYYIIVYDVWLCFLDIGPHMWVQLNTIKPSCSVVKICQKHSPFRLFFCLAVLFFLFIPFMENLFGILHHNFIFEKDFPKVLENLQFLSLISIGIYTMLLLPFLIETNKNKKFIMGLLEAEPYTPPKQSTDNQKSDIIQ